ncbi:MAG: hypothetical protein H6722_23140 [Sandaracinus sp.]|nr:hypothetical protein [Myxococcales bacterium]MCB9615340.1 hypothetical protein [Sandaracinus sp.]
MIRFAIVLLLFRMCGGGDGDRSPHLDGDAGAGRDAGLEPPGADAGTMSPPPNGFPLDPSAGADEHGEGRDDGLDSDVGTCFDGIDNDRESGNVGADCDDAACATLPSCRVGRETSCVASTPGPSFTGCADASCFAGATAFGSPTPFVDGDGLALGGDATYDSGLLFDTAYDLRTQRLSLTARLGLPMDCDGCLESAAFGVTASERFGTEDHVVPVAALVLSGARAEVAFVVGDTTLARFPATEGPWTLELSPTGVARVLEDGVVRHEDARFAREPNARVVLFGHSRNPSATETDAARIRELRVDTARCDMPSAWSEPQTLRFERGARSWSAEGATSPSIALDPSGVPTLVLLMQGALHVAKAPDPASPERFVPTAPDGLDDTPVMSDVREAELLATTDGFDLYVRTSTELGGNLERHALSADGRTLTAGATLTLPVARTSGFAVIRRNGYDFLVTSHDDRTVQAWVSFDASRFEAYATLPVDELDADAVGSPDLYLLGATYRVTLPVRRGTRWRTALFVSDDFVHWRVVDEESASGIGAEERLGLRGQDALIEAGRESWVYESSDGVAERLRRRDRTTP